MTDRKRDELERSLETETQITATTESSGAPEVDVPTLTLLAHPEPARVGERVTLPALASGTTIELSRREPLFAAPGKASLAPLRDVHLSRRPLVLAGDSHDGWHIDRAGCRTPVRIDGLALAERRALTSADLARGVVIELGRRVVLLLHFHPSVEPELPAYGLVGASARVLGLRRQIRLAAGLDGGVLLRGETGTGKELVARALHETGGSSQQPFVAVNMAAIPASLAAAELFGAERGAYTGAGRAKAGFFRRADGGTLFLDEIGEAPAEIQPLLLRALEGGEIQPVGAAKPLRVDVRVVAATDADLDAQVGSGRFRAPLLHRLAAFEIHLPPLRQRRDDIGRLLYHFLTQELGDSQDEASWQVAGKPWPPADLVARLAHHDWPGNVRELRNVAQRLAGAWRTGETLLADQLVASTVTAPREAPASDEPTADREPPTASVDEPASLADLEQALRRLVTAIAKNAEAPHPIGRWLSEELVLAAADAAEGVVGRAASLLSRPETSFRRWLQRARASIPQKAPPARERLRRAIDALFRADEPPPADLLDRLQRLLLREAVARLNEPVAAQVLGITVRTLRRRRRALEPPQLS